MYLAHIGIESSEDLAIGVDGNGSLGFQFEFTELPHPDLLKAAVGAFHHFGDQAKHHQTGDVFDHRVVEYAIIWFGIRRDEETASLTRTVAKDKHEHPLLDGFFIGDDFHEGSIVIAQDGQDHGP